MNSESDNPDSKPQEQSKGVPPPGAVRFYFARDATVEQMAEHLEEVIGKAEADTTSDPKKPIRF